MTLDELIEKARAKGPWRCTWDGRIRNGWQCPLMAVTGEGYEKCIPAAQKLFGGLWDALQVAHAADNDPGHDPAIRAKLLTLVEHATAE